MLEVLSGEVRATEQWLRESVCGDHRVELLRTVLGLGDLLATMVALEIDRIERFASEAKLAAYTGLVPVPLLGRPDVPRQADAADQQVVTLGAGGSGLDSSQTRPLLPHALR